LKKLFRLKHELIALWQIFIINSVNGYSFVLK